MVAQLAYLVRSRLEIYSLFKGVLYMIYYSDMSRGEIKSNILNKIQKFPKKFLIPNTELCASQAEVETKTPEHELAINKIRIIAVHQNRWI